MRGIGLLRAPAYALLAICCAYVLGRLKLLYYYDAFGVDLGSLDLGFRDVLFESWFVVQNLTFLALLWWVALKTRSAWVAAVAVAHAMLPIAAHYAFVFHDSGAARFLIHYRHTLLKLVPFAALVVIWLVAPRHRVALSDLRPPVSRAGLLLFGVIAFSWGISTAKHTGSFDANLALSDPAGHLTRVGVDPAGGGTPVTGELYLLHSSPTTLVLWDATGFVYGRTREIRTLVVPRADVRRLEGSRTFHVQPKEQFL